MKQINKSLPAGRWFVVNSELINGEWYYFDASMTNCGTVGITGVVVRIHFWVYPSRHLWINLNGREFRVKLAHYYGRKWNKIKFPISSSLKLTGSFELNSIEYIPSIHAAKPLPVV